MHYHLEVIMPPTESIDLALKQVLTPFDENNEEMNGTEFFDFYILGGRFAGTKELQGYDQSLIDKFHTELQENKTTISGLQCGKQTLDPASQIPTVDKIWAKYFPTESGDILACPLFSHSNNQYDGNTAISCDITKVEDLNKNICCERVIICGPTYDGKGLEAEYMLCKSIWNGCNHMDIEWDGKITSALAKYQKELSRVNPDYAAQSEVNPNWLCVTVDYHT